MKKNLLILTCHDLGDYVGSYGYPVKTPNLDKLAAEGVCFQNHFSTSTVCSPARGAIQTGCYPHTNGLMGLIHRGWDLNVDKCMPMPIYMRQQGYQTHLFGFQHEHNQPEKLGYENIHKAEGGDFAEIVTDLFTDWLADADLSKPFCAALGTVEVHRMDLPSHFRRKEYTPAETDDVYIPPALPDCPEIRREMADFYGAVNWLDQCIGKIYEALQDKGILDDTLIVFTTDHGASFIHSKATLYDGGTKTALIMRCPELIPAGNNIDALTSHVDIMPTLFKLLEVPVPTGIQGIDAAELLQGNTGNEREYVFAERNVTNYLDPSRMVRDKRFKYIKNGIQKCIFDFVIPELEQCPTGFMRNKAVLNYYSGQRVTEELYDLENDPGELNNLAELPGYADALSRMQTALNTHLQQTNDQFKDYINPIKLQQSGYTFKQEREQK